MAGPGHCLCLEHRRQYQPQTLVPAHYVTAENLRTELFCGRCAARGSRRAGGIVFGNDSLTDGCVQFGDLAAYWLKREELDTRVVLSRV
jgi:hypothetical protein